LVAGRKERQPVSNAKTLLNDHNGGSSNKSGKQKFGGDRKGE